MTLLGAAVLLFLVLTLAGLVWWANDEYDKVKAGEKWPDNWHELIK